MVVIPTYNERDNIERLLGEIFVQGGDIDALIVDDNSPDGTGEAVDRMAAANPRIHVIHRAGKLGLGSAYREGFKYALGKGAEHIVQMDADFSHDPKMLPLFFQKIRDYDLVIG